MKNILSSLISAFTATTKLAEDEKYVLNFAAEIVQQNDRYQTEKQYYLQYNQTTNFFVLTTVSATGIQTAILCDDDILEGLYTLTWHPISEMYEYEDCEYSHLKEIDFCQTDLAVLAAHAKNVDALCS